MTKCLILFAFIIAVPSISNAQFWHTLPPVDSNKTVSACFSNDEKKVFYLSKDGGIANIWGLTIADKYARIIAGPANPPAQITKFTDRGIVRFFHLLNFPQILFMRLAANGRDYHIYRINDDASSQPEDVTPGGDGVTSEIIGASYDGRFVYFTNNKVNHDKQDVYRYDTKQYTSDIIFPNDKDYKVLAWTRNQNKLLIADSSANTLMMYDIESTERTSLEISDGGYAKSAMLDPLNTTNPDGYSLITRHVWINPKWQGIDSNSLMDKMKGSDWWTDFSPNCKYVISRFGKIGSVKDVAANNCLDFPENFCPLAIAPKETMLIYSLPSDGNAQKIFLYDIPKNKSTELAIAR